MKCLSPTTRANIRALLWIDGLILLFIYLQIWDVTTQLNNPALMNWAVTKDEFNGAADSSLGDAIPKIIHQTYKTEDIPQRWVHAQKTVKELNPDYQYILWTDETARDFIATNYSWFLSTYDGYEFPIMRADAIRYFVLYHFGGFYIDMDISLKQPLDGLRNFPSVFYKTTPTGVSNDFMAAKPQHAFFSYMLSSMKKYSGNYLIPYFTVMYSTGPLMLSILIQRYNIFHNRTGVDATRIFVKTCEDSLPWKRLDSFIRHVGGSSWHKGDATTFTFIRDHLIPSVMMIIFLGVSFVVLVFFAELRLIQFVQSKFRKSPAIEELGAGAYDRFKEA